MTEPSTSENKTSVVDDFFSALFANNNSNSETSNISNNNNSSDGNNGNSVNSSRDATVTPIPTNNADIVIKEEAPDTIEEPVENDHHQAIEQANEHQAPPPVLDEFDEYSLLSSRRKSDPTLNPINRTRPNAEQPAQTLAKRHIDWSKVIPESRMLIHQLPKSTSKQELMDYFSKYGEVLEVVQKNTFGFVHFENPEQCARAVEAENYKTFKDVLLNLEICKRKPKFARISESENRRRNNGHRGRHDNNNRNSVSPSRSRSRTPPRRETNKRRNSDTRNGYNNREPKAMNDYRNRQREYNGNNNNNNNNNSNSNRYDNGFDYERTNNYRPDYNRKNTESNNSDNDNDYGRENNYRPDYARRNNNNNVNNGKRVDPRFASDSASGYNYNNNTTTIISRNGNEVPAVQIISWNNDNGLMKYIEKLFAQNSIHTDTATFNYLNYSRDELVRQMVLEGVKAIILIDGRNSNQGKVYLQVFAPIDHGDGVRYDEYDSVTPNEAVSIVQNTHPELRQPQSRYQQYTPQSQKRSKYNAPPPAQSRREPYNAKPQHNVASQYNGSSYARQSEPQFNNANLYQQKPSYYNPASGYQYKSPPLQQPTQQPNYVTQSTYHQHPPMSSTPNIDPNTLATIYNLIQSDTLSQVKSPAVSLPPTTSNQPSIPQLLATLVNSLGGTANTSTPPQVPAATNTNATTSEQPSMAALLSTAAGGNPALAQLLLQMTSGVTNSSSPTPPNANINTQTSPSLISQRNQPQQDYSYNSYGHQRN